MEVVRSRPAGIYGFSSVGGTRNWRLVWRKALGQTSASSFDPRDFLVAKQNTRVDLGLLKIVASHFSMIASRAVR
ncbi:hypothetical protein AB1N83_001024 [Pleurotus pulmonarius]